MIDMWFDEFLVNLRLDLWVVMSFIAALLAMTTSVMIRKRMWLGYALMIPAQMFYAILAYKARLYGFLLLNLFYVVNAAMGFSQWRALERKQKDDRNCKP
jgi:nicotinamide riboside transporter PnuC